MENINFSPQASQIHHTEHISVLGITKNKCYDIFPSCLKVPSSSFCIKRNDKDSEMSSTPRRSYGKAFEKTLPKLTRNITNNAFFYELIYIVKGIKTNEMHAP